MIHAAEQESTCLHVVALQTSDNGEQLDSYTSTFMRMTISNIRQHSPRLW